MNPDLGRQTSEKKIDRLLAERDDLLWQLQWARHTLRQIAHAEIPKSEMKEEARIALKIIENVKK